MDLEERLDALRRLATTHAEVMETEEAAKTALVMPFLQALGYDPFDPFEVKPEFTADVGVKKGEKVDYAIFHRGAASMLIECKDCRTALDPKRFPRQFTQLYRYFGVTAARIAILTNGIEYRFFSDLERPNIMDDEPFYVFSLLSMRPEDMAVLAAFSRDAFDVDALVARAGAMRTRSLIRRSIDAEMEKPSDEFVRLVAGRIHEGRITQSVRDAYAALIPEIAAASIQDRVARRLEQALAAAAVESGSGPVERRCDGIVTTQDEVDGYHVVRAICARYLDPRRVVMRDAKSYCAILLDDNNRKTIVRFHFNNPANKTLGTFAGRDEDRMPVDGPHGIYAHERAIVARLRELDPTPFLPNA